MKTCWLTVASVAFLAFGPWATAADFCVGNSAELQAALDTAATNNESDTIRIRAGDYPVPAGGFEYLPSTTANLDDDLQLSGGWVPFFFPCGFTTADPASTRLDGGGIEPVMQMNVPALGLMEVSFLTFVNGAEAPKGGIAGLRVSSPLPSSARISISHNVFRNNSAGVSSGLFAVFFGGSGLEVGIFNNVFIDNSAVFNEFAAGAVAVVPPPSLQDDDQQGNVPTVVFAHNTVSNNQSVDGAGGILLQVESTELDVVGNNLWGNSGDDLVLQSTGIAQALRLLNNNIQSLRLEGTTAPTLDQGNINTQPVYADCGPGCFALVPVLDSPLVNAGLDPAAFGLSWSLPATDAAGEPRINGPRIDIGAYEALEAIFADRFED